MYRFRGGGGADIFISIFFSVSTFSIIIRLYENEKYIIKTHPTGLGLSQLKISTTIFW